MVSIVDLGTLHEEVTVRGQKLKVGGLSAEQILDLLVEFPELRMVFVGKAVENPVNLIMEKGGRMLGSIILRGLGEYDTADPELLERKIAAARGLAIGEQTEILQTIFRISFPKGVTSFMEGLTAIMGSAVVEPTKEAATK